MVMMAASVPHKACMSSSSGLPAAQWDTFWEHLMKLSDNKHGSCSLGFQHRCEIGYSPPEKTDNVPGRVALCTDANRF